MEEINRENFSTWLCEFLKREYTSERQFAEAVGCSEATIYRLKKGFTLPSDEMLNQTKVANVLGFPKYSNLSTSQKKKILELAGGAGGGVVGVAGIALAVNTMGVAGLSAAGITSGLAAIGGTMMGGVMVATVAPAVAGAVCYASVRGIKRLAKKRKLVSVMNFSPHFCGRV